MCFMERAISTTAANEVWRPVKGYEGYYEVSNLGRVRSLDRYVQYRFGLRLIKGRILKQRLWGNYKTVTFTVDRVEDRRYIHRIVAESFIPNPQNLPFVNHKDEDKLNNASYNLEWCTHSYNMNYGTRTERYISTRSIPIEQLTLKGKHVAYYKNAREVDRLSGGRFKNTHIYDAINGGLETAYGYLWRRVEKGSIPNDLFSSQLIEVEETVRLFEQLTMEGKHVAYFRNIITACKQLSYNEPVLWAASAGKKQSAYGYRWRYVELPGKDIDILT